MHNNATTAITKHRLPLNLNLDKPSLDGKLLVGAVLVALPEREVEFAVAEELTTAELEGGGAVGADVETVGTDPKTLDVELP